MACSPRTASFTLAHSTGPTHSGQVSWTLGPSGPRPSSPPTEPTRAPCPRSSRNIAPRSSPQPPVFTAASCAPRCLRCRICATAYLLVKSFPKTQQPFGADPLARISTRPLACPNARRSSQAAPQTQPPQARQASRNQAATSPSSRIASPLRQAK